MRGILMVSLLYVLVSAVPSTALALRSETALGPAGRPANYVDGAVVAACSSTSGYHFPSSWRTEDDSAVTEVAKLLPCGNATLYDITSFGRIEDISVESPEESGGMVVLEISGLCALPVALCGLIGLGAVVRRRRTRPQYYQFS